jgi:two-component system, chemotaxis family, protein-glutamate methylesterase/glutaminase
MINVLVVDDSAVVRDFLAYILNSDPEIRVMGQAGNGVEALDFIRHQNPDVITMDVEMPEMGGLEATRRIMEFMPVPIVIVSANWEPVNVDVTFKAVEAGAVSLVTKPSGMSSPAFQAQARELVNVVKNASMARVHRLRSRSLPDNLDGRASLLAKQGRKSAARIKIVAIGASTGGPPVVKELLDSLPGDFPFPVMVVQHISRGFTRGFVDWLNEGCPLRVCEAARGEYIQAGRVYVAPEDFQMGVTGSGFISLRDDPPEHSVRPSASYLFRSLARFYKDSAVGILLTGMGVDGAFELKLIREAGGITFAQDRETSVVHGMPGEAIRLGGAVHVMNPRGISGILADLAVNSSKQH